MAGTIQAVLGENIGSSEMPAEPLDDCGLVSLIEGRPITESFEKAVAAYSAPYTLVAIKPCWKNADEDRMSLSELMAHPSAQCPSAIYDDLGIAFLMQSEARKFIDGILEKAKAAHVIIVSSLPFDDLGDIARQHHLVRFCMQSIDAGGIYEAKPHVLPYLVSEIRAAIDTESLLHPALDTLARYDEANQSNLLHTLRVYLEHDRSAQRCANMLYLHRNSLQYRIKRIQEIAGINLDDPDERAYLRLSFLLS